MKVIYIGSHNEVVLPGVIPGVKVVRHGPTVDIPDDVAKELVARGDFMEFVPEPKPRPVEKTKPKAKE